MHFEPAYRHAEGIVAEFQLAAFFADFIHRKIGDPAELVLLFIHMSFAGGAEEFDQHARHLDRVFAGRDHYESVGLQRNELIKLLFLSGKELCDAACELPVRVRFEPVALRAGLHFAVGKQLFDLLTRKITV